MNAEQIRMTIVYQGEPGANSHMACSAYFSDYTPMACPTFDEAFAAVEEGRAGLAMIPIENSVAGRVGDIHFLLQNTKLSIIGERFLPIHHQLLGVKGAKLSDIKIVKSHVMALGQCRKIIRKNGMQALIASDTAGAAREIAQLGDSSIGAIASRLAASIYDLDILANDIEDEDHNTTRFVILAKNKKWAKNNGQKVMTSFVFHVRNLPAALYKALGGFATNGVNITKLESYLSGKQFYSSQFYVEAEGHPDSLEFRQAIEELQYYSREFHILGVFPADPYREAFKEGHG